ncbi:DNA topoisomerase I [Candidatus Hydrogenisulfobacillus filiaventi]|uniref:DNA topoisomerase 1 n=1 Tax=Candidatus Hydrogenisulfobacillus filiaventi TaxID=2707344 RepID=A0A6F8ZHC6_9FIRM|nr:type I DNA topoisomerase [Bacillota bacterium]CAB1129079.1 DNA topoisomerase I [Candidatus Hydrogenisulfobacillus filiaventi]
MAKAKPLIIVESPAKAKTITRFLGRNYTVKASMGHVRDLPKSQFGVDIAHGFEPRYITIRGKGEVIRELKEAVRKAGQVYLATDPDREGEAISWHLASVLGLDPAQAQRIEFHEITKEAVANALKHARHIDMRRVDAQQARRVLDRVVGYQLSPLLWRKVRPGLSAGRVQSAALRLLVDRERAIRAFVPEEFYTIEAALRAPGGEPFTAQYVGPLGEKGHLRREEAEAVQAALAGVPFRVLEVTERPRRRQPPLPFTTSTLQQEAARQLGFTVKRTMAVAQQLYEGLDVPGEGTVGLITYIRTDSVRVADQAHAEARAYVADHFGAEYVGQPRPVKDKPGVQGAHEAIRPTSVARHPDALKAALNRDQARLYRLVWERFLASEMAPAVYDQRTVDIGAGEARFRASGSTLRFAGYTRVYQEAEEEGKARTPETRTLPRLEAGQALGVEGWTAQQHFTEPPPRFTEASLVHALEELGIGRPSTYAPIIETLLARGYAVREQRRLQPTELGEVVVDLLKTYFPEIVDTAFTADVESQLDRVEEGETPWREVLQRFYDPFAAELSQADAAIPRVELKEETTDEVCDKCGRPMVVKHGRFGRFLACSGYPECKNTRPYVEKTGALCPKCGSPIVVRKTRKGRTLYGCSAYPACDFVTWSRPSTQTCPRCGAAMAFKRRGARESLVCLREGCGYEQDEAL